MSSPSNLIIEADGGSRGNPGIAGSGACVIDADTGEVILEISKFIGVATNNVAEYLALVAGLEGAYALNPDARVLVRMDSKLVIEQMAGRWKIKHPDMQQLGARVQKLVSGKQIRWQWIPREENSRADALANKAMDEQGDAVVSVAANSPRASVVEFNQELPSSVRAPGGVTEPLTTVVLVRHGRTHLTESKRISGRGGENPGLSDLGREDAHKVAKALADIGNAGPWSHLAPISAIVSSPIQRTLDTAHIISNQLGLGISVNEDIAEISFGDWDGHTNDEVMSKWDGEFSRWQGSWTVSPPNGESLEHFDARVQKGRRSILADFAGKTVAVVSHVMPIRGFIKAGMDSGVAGYWRPQISPCSITIMRFWGDQAAEVITVNATSHL
ncbi:MAG: bifunctional RNase H/acid phosphatase [Rhodoluna sp.]|nr:bifunctional RNase H/acid phosphatase [Rhodoluna sp.]